MSEEGKKSLQIMNPMIRKTNNRETKEICDGTERMKKADCNDFLSEDVKWSVKLRASPVNKHGGKNFIKEKINTTSSNSINFAPSS
jgi:hypothetical protein